MPPRAAPGPRRRAMVGAARTRPRTSSTGSGLRAPCQADHGGSTMRTTPFLRRALLPALCAGLLAAAPAWSAEPGFYVGGKLGAASVDGDFIDDDDTSWGAYAGYQFNDWLALEAVYTD